MTLTKVRVLTILLVMLTAGLASAALSNLPESSHLSGKTRTWMEVGDTYIDVKIEFAVYDTQADGFAGLGLTTPGDGRYLYAYQLFCYSVADYGLNDVALQYFRLTDSSEPTAIGYEADSAGEAPTDAYVDAYYKEPVWEFDGGILTAGKNSAFLLLSSDQDWVEGWFAVTPPSDDPTGGDGTGTNTGGNQTPEPATMLLLAAGSIAAFRRKRV
jgi:hypothetical protein